MTPFNSTFDVARLPAIHFANGAVEQLPGIIAGYHGNVLLVTGKASFLATAHWQNLTRALDQRHIRWFQFGVADEPSPQLVDDAVARHRQDAISDRSTSGEP